jgi:8-oxo-dGTP pyrophosphatase MutT (NUDIX family)
MPLRARLKTRIFTAGILARRGKLLVMKRKRDDDTYAGLWDCVGGHFESAESAEDCMVREAREESGLRVNILRPGTLIEYRDEYGRSIAVPFLLESLSGRVTLSEHTEFRWISPVQARRLASVPALKMAMDAVAL